MLTRALVLLDQSFLQVPETEAREMNILLISTAIETVRLVPEGRDLPFG